MSTSPASGSDLPSLRDGALLSSRIADRIRKDVSESELRFGDKLPPERQLTQRYQVSRSTMRRALRQLEVDGYLMSERSRGWFVSRKMAATASSGPVPQVGGRVLGFADNAREQGLRIAARVLHQRVRPASLDEAEALRMAPGAALFDLRRLRLLDDVAIVVEYNRVPLAMCPQLEETDFTTSSLYATLRHADPPQVPTTVDYSVEARAATDEERSLLDLVDAVPVLRTALLTCNAAGRPIEMTRASYRGDRYRYRASVTGTS